MKKLIITALMSLIIGIGAINAATINPPHRKGREIRHDKREIRQDKKRLHHNIQNGNTKRAKHNARELRRDKHKLRHDRRKH